MRDVMMIQMGARRNYAYPRQLEAAGMLHSLVTDAAWPSPEAPAARLLSASDRLKGAVRRRIPLGIAPGRLAASILPNAMSIPWPGLAKERRFAFADDLLGKAAARRWDGSVRVVVNYFGNGGRFLESARARGATIVTDFISHPLYWDIVAAERAQRPGWERGTDGAADRAAYRARFAWLVRISDIYCCPSPAIAEALAEFPEFDERRVRLLPYGAPPVEPFAPRPEPGRILCAASAITLAKGIAYLGEAAARLKTRSPAARIVVAGAVPESLAARPELSALDFLGPLDPEAMAAEYARADVFCLPTLAEGSATVLFEAMNRGVPCVTTAMSGSVITDGIDGLIVPERDADATAGAIFRIVDNRDLRATLAVRARETAVRYSDRACGDAFIEMIADLPRANRG